MVYNPYDGIVGQTCAYCRIGVYEEPPDDHPSYCLCNSCGAIQLTYVPMDHQAEFHRTEYQYNEDGTIKTQTLSLFGGRKSVAAVKGIKFRGTLRASAYDNPEPS